MVTAVEIAQALGKARKSGDGWACQCPAHEDKNPSLHIQQDGERILVHCHAGCSQEEVIAELKNLNLWPTQSEANPREAEGAYERIMEVPSDTRGPSFEMVLGRRPSMIFQYRSRSGATLGYTVRIEENGLKTFRPVTPWRDAGGNLVWLSKGFSEPLPLFNQHQLERSPNADVLVVEGEKTAEAAQRQFPELAVVTWPNGANAAGRADWQVIATRRVILWPDADDAGRSAMGVVGERLTDFGVEDIRQVDLPDLLPKGWDLADATPDGFDVQAALRDAPEIEPTLARFIYTVGDLLKLPVPKLEYVIAPFLPTHSLSMVYAERGLGKTWFCLTFALQVARGEKFMRYDVPKPRRVLYVDGEMALAELQERIRLLGGDPPEFLDILPSEILFREDRPLNLNDIGDQDRILAALARRERNGLRPEIIVFDNLSSLSRGVDENSNSDLDTILSFLLSLRHAGYSVLLVHHAGKTGMQRGASRREDLLNLSIQLKKPEERRPDEAAGGAHFIMEFSKVRGKPPRPPRLEIRLVELDSKAVEWRIEDAPEVRAEDEALRAIAINTPQTQKQLADILGVSSGRVSQLCKMLKSWGFLESGTLRPTGKGFDRLCLLWPGDADKFDRQDEIPI